MRLDQAHRFVTEFLAAVSVFVVVATAVDCWLSAALVASLVAVLMTPTAWRERLARGHASSIAVIALLAVQLGRGFLGEAVLQLPQEFAVMLIIMRIGTRVWHYHDDQINTLALLNLIGAAAAPLSPESAVLHDTSVGFVASVASMALLAPAAMMLSCIHRAVWHASATVTDGVLSNTSEVRKALASRRVVDTERLLGALLVFVPFIGCALPVLVHLFALGPVPWWAWTPLLVLGVLLLAVDTLHIRPRRTLLASAGGLPNGAAPTRRRSPRFTRRGKYVLGLTLGIGFAAINTSNEGIYVLLGVMLSLIAISDALRHMSHVGLAVAVGAESMGDEGSRLEITILNANKWVPAYALEVRAVGSDGRTGARAEVPHIEPGGSRVVELDASGPFVAVEMVTEFPFGWFECARRMVPSPERPVSPVGPRGVATS